jgi:hypothetical protein
MDTKSKRANGEGSIYKRGDGKWVGSVSIQVPNQGLKRKVFYGKSKTEVREKVLAALNEKQKGTLVTAGPQTVGQFLTDWLENTHRLREMMTADWRAQVFPTRPRDDFYSVATRLLHSACKPTITKHPRPLADLPEMCDAKQEVAHTGFEPVISALRGRCPGPLDECALYIDVKDGHC